MAKTVLQNIFKGKKDEDNILRLFCEIIVHSHIKMTVFKLLTEVLESLCLKYRIKENEVNKQKTIFTITLEPKKNKIIEIEINKKEIFCTAYSQICVANFIPLVPQMRICLKEIPEIILSTIELQKNYLGVIAS